MRIVNRYLVAAGIIVAAGLMDSSLHAHDHAVDELHIDHPWARAMPAGASVGGGYMTIRNEGSQADRLLGGSSPRADRLEIHQMTMEGDVMRMRPLKEGLEIASGATVELKPSGLHVMFVAVTEPFAEGERVPAVLVFEKAGEVEVEFTVEGIAAGAPEHDHEDGHAAVHGTQAR